MSPFHRLVPPSVLGLVLSETVLIFTCYGIATVVLLAVDPWIFALHDRGFLRAGIIAAAVQGGLYMQDLYDDLRSRQRMLLVQQLCLALGLAFLLQASLNYLDTALVFPRWIMLLGSTLLLPAMTGWRILYSSVIESTDYAERVLFLGDGPQARRLDEGIRKRPQLGITGIGFLTEGVPGANGLCTVGHLNELRAVVDRLRPDRVVVALEGPQDSIPQADLLELRFSGIAVDDAESLYERVFDRVWVPKLRPDQLIFSSEFGPRPQALPLQLVYSIVIAVAGLVVYLPLMLVAAVLVKLTSPGPILYRQKRIGLRGRVFSLYKFRSMFVNAEPPGEAVWARKDDPRVTPVGRWLRRFRIDEIPQLWNVLKGDMLIVGPRPERPEFIATLTGQIPYYRQRLVVKPGITGWAQINHKYGDSMEDAQTKLEYDIYYIKNWTLALDAYIMFHTIKVILLGRGAQ